MICIICRIDKKEAEFNEEHIIPDSIGGKVCIFRVCKECNSKLGSNIDSKLLNNILMDLVRYEHKLTGKKGKLPNPFNKGVLADDPSRIVHFDGAKPIIMPKVIKDKVNKTVQVKCSSHEESIDIARKVLERNNIGNLTDEEVQKRIISSDSVSFQPEVKINETIDMGGIEIALVKIAYEFAFHWLGEVYLNDEYGKKLAEMLFSYSRDKTYSERYDELVGFSSENGGLKTFEEKYAPLFGFDSKKIHTALMLEVENEVVCIIKLLNAFERKITVSKSPMLYSGLNMPFLLFNDINEAKVVEGTLLNLLMQHNIGS